MEWEWSGSGVGVEWEGREVGVEWEWSGRGGKWEWSRKGVGGVGWELEEWEGSGRSGTGGMGVGRVGRVVKPRDWMTRSTGGCADPNVKGKGCRCAIEYAAGHRASGGKHGSDSEGAARGQRAGSERATTHHRAGDEDIRKAAQRAKAVAQDEAAIGPGHLPPVHRDPGQPQVGSDGKQQAKSGESEDGCRPETRDGIPQPALGIEGRGAVGSVTSGITNPRQWPTMAWPSGSLMGAAA